MKEGQTGIYYMAADSMDAAASAPFVEKLVQKGYEVRCWGPGCQRQLEAVMMPLRQLHWPVYSCQQEAASRRLPSLGSGWLPDVGLHR